MSKNIEDTRLITRREFTLESALAMLAGVTITVTGCGGSTESPASPTPGASGVSGAISANHGHVATITGAQLMSGGGLSLNIQGSADHPHTVELSAEDMQRITARQQVTKTSSSDNAHTHTVTFN